MHNSNKNDFLEIKNSLNKKDSEFLELAYNFAEKAHKWQKRKSGEPYFIHPLSVAVSLWKRFWDLELMVAGLLHDTVEDCKNVDISDIYKIFWKNVWFMVDSVTKGEKTFYNETEIIEDIKDKMIAGWIKDIRCILLKLADREHNLATLSYMPPDKQVKKSFESQSLYIPLMHILWFWQKSCLDIKKCSILFKNFLQENNLSYYKDIKNYLLNICFNNFNEELFEIVYKNSTSVVWELNDKVFFDELVENWWFDSEGVEIQSIETTFNWDFKVIFYFKKWVVLQNLSWKFNIYNKKIIWKMIK